MNNFGVFYTCYTEFNAVKYSLEVLYKIYEEVKVLLISDGGLDYKELEYQFPKLKTLKEEDSRGLIPKIPPDKFEEDYWQKVIKSSIEVFLQRINKAIEYCEHPQFMLIMEPDVLVRNSFTILAKTKLLGTAINSGFSKELRTLLQNTPNAVDNNNWGAVPPIFETESFLKAYNNLIDNPELFDKMCSSDWRIANYDMLLPVMFNLIGLREEFNPEIVECFRDSNWENSWHPIVHQYRAKYPLKSEGYNGTHVNHQFGLGDTWLWNR